MTSDLKYSYEVEMKKSVVILIVGALTLLPALAHGEEKSGILVDANCGAELMVQAGQSDETDKAAAHPVSCALDNKDSGYGIISDGKFLRFDDFGNKQARLLLKATQKKTNLKVRVGGHFEGDLIKVSEIETIE